MEGTDCFAVVTAGRRDPQSTSDPPGVARPTEEGFPMLVIPDAKRTHDVKAARTPFGLRVPNGQKKLYGIVLFRTRSWPRSSCPGVQRHGIPGCNAGHAPQARQRLCDERDFDIRVVRAAGHRFTVEVGRQLYSHAPNRAAGSPPSSSNAVSDEVSVRRRMRSVIGSSAET